MHNRDGVVVGAELTRVAGKAERETALRMITEARFGTSS
jgi:hypothetical protein